MAGPAIPTNRTTANTVAEHVNDHNLSADIANMFDKDATPATHDSLAWNGTVYIPVADLVNARTFGVVGNDSTDDTTNLQAFITYCVDNGKTGFIPPGVYKITAPLDFHVRRYWAIMGAHRGSVTIKQYTDNVAILNLGSDPGPGLFMSNSRISGLTLDYANSQPSTNTNANPILLSDMWFQNELKDIRFNRGCYAIKVASGIGGPWGSSWDDLVFSAGLTKGAMDWAGAINAVPNNHWGRFFVDAANMVGPIFNQIRGYNFVIDTIEIISATLGPQLMFFASGVDVNIGALKLEYGTYTTSGMGLIEFNSDGSARIGSLFVGGTGFTINVPAGTLTLLKSGTGGAGTASHGGRIHIDRINAGVASLTGSAYLLQTGTPHVIDVGGVDVSGGWVLTNIGSTPSSDNITVRRFLNDRMNSNRGDADYTVAVGDTNINKFTTPFTAQRTITLPTDGNIFNGLYYEFIFDGAINGANNALIKASATTLATITTDGVYRYTWYRQGTPANGWLGTTNNPKRQVDVFTANGTYNKPAGATTVQALCIGAGGGGGGGARYGAAVLATGGAGGGGGGFSQSGVIPAAAVASSVSVVVGTAGTAGTAAAGDTADGGAGVGGGTSSFGNITAGTAYGVRAGGGGGGGAGNTTGAATAGTAGTATMSGSSGTAGGASSATGGAGTAGTAGTNASGGGAGGGITTGNTAASGGAGGANNLFNGGGGTAGVAGGASPGNGSSGVAGVSIPGTGGGGGAGNAAGVGQTGATGGTYGGGGGGGGASRNGSASGPGGAGGPGLVIVITEF